MARKARSQIADYAVYLAVRFFVCVVQALPVTVAYAIADVLAALAYRFDKKHRNIATDNIQHAFPAWTPQKVKNTVKACFRHYLRVVVEMILLPRKLHCENFQKYMTLNSGTSGGCAFLTLRPLLLLTGHVGNWEMIGYGFGVLGYRSYAVARVLDNPYLEAFLKKFRERTGQTIIAKKDDFDRFQQVLKNNGMVGILADQDAGPRGVFVPFLQRQASAHKAVGLLALEYNALVVVGATVRVGDGMNYESVVVDTFSAGEYANDPNAVKAIVTRYHAGVQKMVEKYPEQYFWFHRRWKSQPAARKTVANKAA